MIRGIKLLKEVNQLFSTISLHPKKSTSHLGARLQNDTFLFEKTMLKASETKVNLFLYNINSFTARIPPKCTHNHFEPFPKCRQQSETDNCMIWRKEFGILFTNKKIIKIY